MTKPASLAVPKGEAKLPHPIIPGRVKVRLMDRDSDITVYPSFVDDDGEGIGTGKNYFVFKNFTKIEVIPLSTEEILARIPAQTIFKSEGQRDEQPWFVKLSDNVYVNDAGDPMFADDFPVNFIPLKLHGPPMF